MNTSLHLKQIKRLFIRSIKQEISRISDLFYLHEKISLKLTDQQKGVVKRMCGKTIAKYLIIDGREIKYTEKDIDSYNDVLYLKVDRISRYSIMCIQHWVKVCDELGGKIFILCDNRKLERKILKEIEFSNMDFSIIKSNRKELKYLGKFMYSYYWKNVAYAHLTPFYLSQKYKVNKFWAIDADDTTILAEPKIIAEYLKNVEKRAIEDKISAFSLDMWRSRLPYDIWTFGIAFLYDTNNFMKIFENTKSRDWMIEYGTKRGINLNVANIDNYLAYLGDTGQLNTKTYYLKDVEFIHWDDVLEDRICSQLYYWNNNKLHLPIETAVPQSDFPNKKGSYELKDGSIEIGL